MPAARLYPLFTRLGIRAVCVISLEGRFCGVISRDGLIAHIQSLHGHSTSRRPSAAKLDTSHGPSGREVLSDLEDGLGLGDTNDITEIHGVASL
mmetsp:Transcript_106366/g.317926  ORF Transcript_106366/g.317926 Transcript_106366/m.317926 type:complete len:94 (+) Transcript_106366:2-283(+)